MKPAVCRRKVVRRAIQAAEAQDTPHAHMWETHLIELGRKLLRAIRGEGRNCLQIGYAPEQVVIDVSTDESGYPMDLYPDHFFPPEWDRAQYGNMMVIDLAFWSKMRV